MAADAFRALVDQMSEETWRNMRRAVETGRWPDGRPLKDGQRELCLQAVIAWEARYLPEERRTGHVERAECDSHPEEQPVTLRPAREGEDDAR